MKIKILPRFKRQAKEIAQYIALDKPKAARNWMKKLKETIKPLHDFPRMGRPVPEYGGEDTIREIIYGNYRVLYIIQPDKIIVAAIWHGKRQLPDIDIFLFDSIN